jgi:hypothetical protein
MHYSSRTRLLRSDLFLCVATTCCSKHYLYNALTVVVRNFFWAIICMMDIQAWGSEFVRTMTGLTVLWGFLSMIVAYLVLALVDRWILQRGRKGPVQWPILGNGQSYFQCLPLFKFLLWVYLCCASYVRFQLGFSMSCFYENYCILSSVLPVYNWLELIRIVIKV